MTRKEKRRVRDIVESEGLGYAVEFYSEFPEIKDKEFHRLRKELVDALKAFREYVGLGEC